MSAHDPILALGTAQWGLDYGISNSSGRMKESAVRAIVNLGAEGGIRLLDTANDYGASESLIGRFANDTTHWRVFTKLAVSSPGSHLSTQQQREHAQESLASSRSALRRDHLDGVLLHRPHQYYSPMWDVLLEEQGAKRIGMIGYSVVSQSDAWSALEHPDINVVQVPGSLLDQRLYRSGWFERARNKGLTIVLRSVFLQGAGLMSSRDLPDFLRPLGSALALISEWAGQYRTTVLCAFLLAARQLGAHAVLVGCHDAEQLHSIINAWESTNTHTNAAPELLSLVPELPESILDPMNWPVG